MKISEISMHNFRSIKDATFVLENYSLLVGANNAGKSNITDAVRNFYEHGKKSEDCKDKCWFNDKGDDEVWIEIEYNLTDDEYADFEEEYRLPNNKLKIRKYIKITEEGGGGTHKPGYYAYTKDNKICEKLFCVEKNIGSKKLGSIIYIPAQSNIEEQTKLTGPSPLRELIANVLECVTEGNTGYGELKTSLSHFIEEIKTVQTEDGKSLTQLQSEISDSLKDWDTKFEFDFKPLNTGNIIKNLISYKIQEAVENMNPSNMGSGFQRHLIFSLIDIAAKYQEQKKANMDKDFMPTTSLLLFEEPEAFLHPDRQLSLCRNLKRLADGPINQVLVSSHSPHFISQNTDDIPSIIRLNKSDKLTEVGQISKDKLKDILESNLKLPDGVKDDREEADKNEENEAIKYSLWLDPNRSSCFFSKHILLVEGATEKGLFNYLIDKGFVKVPSGGVFILDSMGKQNMPKFMKLFEGFKILHSVIFDRDKDSGDNKQWNNLIEEETKNDFTKNIKSFPSDLEAMLEVDKPKDARRKPQRLLYNWINGNISEEKQNELIKLLSEAIAE
jgi:predicted ATP-dependent endonuclease of OLD family